MSIVFYKKFLAPDSSLNMRDFFKMKRNKKDTSLDGVGDEKNASPTVPHQMHPLTLYHQTTKKSTENSKVLQVNKGNSSGRKTERDGRRDSESGSEGCQRVTEKENVLNRAWHTKTPSRLQKEMLRTSVL